MKAKPKAKAFTLIELLVVIAIVALLAVILAPSLNSVMALARQALCGSNLHQISGTFSIGQSQGTSQVKGLFPSTNEWPTGPQRTVDDTGIFWCPDGPGQEGMEADTDDYAVFLQDEGPEGMYLDFQPTNAHPWRLVFDKGDYWEYWFEDGKMKDIDGGVDFVFHVNKAPPRVAVFQDVPHNTWRITAVSCRGTVLPGWENLSNNAKGDSFIMDGTGLSNYGLNGSAAASHSVAPDTIVLLDYDRTIANVGEDMGEYLDQSARHGGKCNVLHAGGEVTSQRPLELDPLVDPNPWTAD